MKKWVVGIVMCLGLFVLLICRVSAELRINEVMPHTNNSYSNEWIEIYNNGTENLTLENWTFYDALSSASYSNISFNISSGEYLIIADDTIDCPLIKGLYNLSCINFDWLGSKLNDGGDSILLYNVSQLISSFSYFEDIKVTGKSWSYNGTGWKQCTPSPGLENNCTSIIKIAPNISIASPLNSTYNISSIMLNVSSNNSIVNWSYSLNGAAAVNFTPNTTIGVVNGTNRLTVYAVNENGTGNASVIFWVNTSMGMTPASSSDDSDDSNDISINLDWNDEDIINGDEFEITVEADNLESEDYDVKIEIRDDDDNLISERYGNYKDKEVWKSGTYYIEEFISGSGDESEDMKIRIKSDYSDFHGDATISAKIRISGSSKIIDEVEKDIEILAPEDESNNDNSDDSDSSSPSSSSSSSSGSITGGVINLGSSSSKTNSSEVESTSGEGMIYKSKNEYMKEYAIYGFGVLCIGLIVMLIRDKKFKV